MENGDIAPNFEIPSTGGGNFDLASATTGRQVLLAFYPKSFTSGCTHEMEVLKFLHPRFAAAGVQVFGVSIDSLQTQHRFKQSLDLPFELLADDQAAAVAFDCLRESGKAERDIYLVGEGGRVNYALHELDPRSETQYRDILAAAGADTENL